jgi:hypothetical protein
MVRNAIEESEDLGINLEVMKQKCVKLFKHLRRNDDRLSFRAASGIASCGYDSAHSLDGATDGVNIGSCVFTIRTLACEVASR